MTQDQANTLDGFHRVADDINYIRQTAAISRSIAQLRGEVFSDNQLPSVITITDKGLQGSYIFDPTDTTSVDNTGIVIQDASGRRYKRAFSGAVNVKWFGAKGDRSQNDSPAIQAAIDYAKDRQIFAGGNVRIEVIIPDGIYYLQDTINLTNINGITVRGMGKYLNVWLECNTGGAVFDCSGMTMGKVSGFSFISTNGFTNRSSIGIQFALTVDSDGNQLGGLNNAVDNCYFQLDDNETANAGFGTIGILNMAAEEFCITNTTIRSNCGMVFAYNKNLSSTGHNYTVSSNYAIVAPGNRSMSAVEISQNVSIQNYHKRSPAIVLIGCAAFKIFAYLTRTATTSGVPATLGTEERALAMYGPCDNIEFEGNVESFSTVASLGSSANIIAIKVVTSNQTDITKPYFIFTGCMDLNDSRINVSPTSSNEINSNNRRFIEYGDIDNGNSVATIRVTNSCFSCTSWINNAFFVPGNLLKKCTNVEFNTRQPFKKRGNLIESDFAYDVPLGNIVAGNPAMSADVVRFLLADKFTKTSGNAGYYKAIIEGTIIAGDYSSARSYLDFKSTISYTQNANGTAGITNSTTIITSQLSDNPAFLDIKSINVGFLFDGYGHIRIDVINAGTGVGQPVVFSGSLKLLSDFSVNQSLFLQ